MKIATMRANTRFAVLSLALSLAGYSLPAFAQDTGEPDKAAIEKSFPAKRPYSPYAGRPFPNARLLGRYALAHDSYSMDAGPLVRGSDRRTLTCSPRGKRSPLPVDNA